MPAWAAALLGKMEKQEKGGKEEKSLTKICERAQDRKAPLSLPSLTLCVCSCMRDFASVSFIPPAAFGETEGEEKASRLDGLREMRWPKGRRGRRRNCVDCGGPQH